MFILISLIILSFLIIVHEWGHFIVARLTGIQVDEFSVGFGPKLLGWQPVGQPTLYALRLFPLGGYVKMAGMEPDDDNLNGFNKKPLLSRMAVILAGSVTNFLIAVILFIMVFSVLGVPIASNANVIGEIVQGSPASQIGLQVGDRVLQVNNVATIDWNKVAATIHQQGEKSTTLVVQRKQQRLNLRVTPKYDTQLQFSQIGIRQSVVWEKQGLIVGVRLGLKRTVTFTQLILQGLGGIVTGAVSSKDLAGPVGITQMIGDAARSGIGYLLTFTGMLGLNLALVNLLPIPAMDGSRFIFLIVEGLRGKPVDPDKENLIHMVGFALLMVLFLVITYNDILRLVAGG